MMKTAAILCGGGPAPGKNGVIEAAVKELYLRGWKVEGIIDGFDTLMRCAPRAVTLTPENVRGISASGGSILGTSRANPAACGEFVECTIESLCSLRVEFVITIGGNDTLRSSAAIARAAGGRIRFVHVPKTIDNDLPLPEEFNTFGFATAVKVGSEFVHTLREDSRTTGDRHFLALCMGRDAGFLPLGIAEATSSLVILPEEIAETEKVSIKTIGDVIIGGILKNEALAMQQPEDIRERGSVSIIGEGVLLKLTGIGQIVEAAFPTTGGIVRDAHGNPRLSKIPGQSLLEWEVTERLKQLGVPAAFKRLNRKIEVLGEKVGFGLRCCPPCADDISYAHALGKAAAVYGDEGASEIMVIPDGRMIVQKPYGAMIDETGNAETREVRLARPAFQNLLSKRLLPEDVESKLWERIVNLTSCSSEGLFGELKTSIEFSMRNR